MITSEQTWPVLQLVIRLDKSYYPDASLIWAGAVYCVPCTEAPTGDGKDCYV